MNRSIGVASLVFVMGIWQAGRINAQILDVMPSVSVAGTAVRLSDVVSSAETLPAEWANRVVAVSPGAGASRVLSLAEVAAALHPYDDMRQVVLRGQTDIRVMGKSIDWDTEMIDQAIETYLRKHNLWDAQRFHVARERLPDLQARAKRGSVKVETIRHDERDGYVAQIAYADMDGASRSLALPLDELRPFWSVSRPLPRGTILAADDVLPKWLPVTDAARAYPFEQSVVGMEVRRNLQTGQVPRLGSLAEPYCVKRGEIVRVLYRRSGLSVTLRARALADGRREDRIACVNESSGRRMHVRLTDVREAILEEGAGS